MRNAYQSASTMMLQGCTSDAGKTVLVAGLCRVLQRRAIRVAPFKPQNMALNSAVTIDGGEIGRAQALQAQACGIQAHTDFNPILLKPSSDIGAQVIVHGKALGNMHASDFHAYKKVAMRAVIESHTRLSEAFQTVLVEGAGSPAEINLREGDIANMGFAEQVDCPVVLVADIDRGGVFAHLVGTLELLSSSEQARIEGFIINRFRGDIGLLQPGIDWLEQRTNKPVLGVIPYLHDLYLDAEDAISSQQVASSKSQPFKIAVPVLPRISNHTDFDALRLHPEVDLQFVSVDSGCPAADLIILPGSKNVIADLRQLQQAGWQEGIAKHLRYGGKLLGICGGYQMLGQMISDPVGIESPPGSQCKGFGYLRVDTELQADKNLSRVDGYFDHPSLADSAFSGYQIHCGSSISQDSPIITLHDKQSEGAINQDNNVLGSYIHGLFDIPEACQALLSWAGMQDRPAVDMAQLREAQLDRLADCLEKNLDQRFLAELCEADWQHARVDQC